MKPKKQFTLDDVELGYYVTAFRETENGQEAVTGKVSDLQEDPTIPAVQLDGARHWVPMECVTEVTRPLSLIARDIRKDWGAKLHAHHPARPYVEAMEQLGTVKDMYGHDDGDGIVRRFLVNASGWRGDVARYVKAELKQMVGLK